jgi:transcriptional regulator with XRE-family HTH domain
MVNPRLVAWARERAGLTLDVLAKRVGTKEAKITAWEAGSSRPTFKQAQKLAAVTHVPFGYLFLPKPPVTELGIPDLRTVPGERPFDEDPNFVDELLAFQFKMDWYRVFRTKKGLGPLAFVGRFKQRRDAIKIAKDMPGRTPAATTCPRATRRQPTPFWLCWLNVLSRWASGWRAAE